MASRFRNLSKTRITFFAFQDIITSVTGILLLVTLILTLYLNNTALVAVASVGAGSASELDQIRQTNAVLQARLSVLSTAPSAEQLREQTRELQRRVADLSQQLTDSDAARMVSLDEAVRDERDLESRVSQAEARQRQEQSELIRLGRQITFVRERQRTAKEPIPIIVSSNRIVLDRFGTNGTARELTGRQLPQQLAGTLSSFDPRRDYFVFFVRPSGISVYQECEAVATGAGFQIGRDLIAEDLQLAFRNPIP